MAHYSVQMRPELDLTLSQMHPTRNLTSYSFFRFILILSSHLRQGLPSDFSTTILYAFLTYFMRATCLAYGISARERKHYITGSSLHKWRIQTMEFQVTHFSLLLSLPISRKSKLFSGRVKKNKFHIYTTKCIIKMLHTLNFSS